MQPQRFYSATTPQIDVDLFQPVFLARLFPWIPFQQFFEVKIQWCFYVLFFLLVGSLQN